MPEATPGTFLMGHSVGFRRPEGSRLIESTNLTSVAEAHFVFAIKSSHCKNLTLQRQLHTLCVQAEIIISHCLHCGLQKPQ